MQFPGAGGYRITFPVAEGDTGLLLFAESSLDKWLVSGGTVDPEDDRRHDLTDAVFLPGCATLDTLSPVLRQTARRSEKTTGYRSTSTETS